MTKLPRAEGDGSDRRAGDEYRVSEFEKDCFERDGFVHLRGVLSEDEVREIEAVYMRFVRREIEVPGKDYCDMADQYGGDPESFSLINVMLPRRYHPPWQGNLFECRSASIARQLHGEGLEIDYDQLLAKRPRRENAVFHWHQDQAYWPFTADSRTATIWLALDDSTEENGCMRFIPGSHTESKIREHRPLLGDRGDSHTLVLEIDEERDPVHCAEIRRGDVTVHDQRVIHGSGGNRSDGWRRAYIVAFRARSAIAEERAKGFTHSHNDAPDVLDDVGG